MLVHLSGERCLGGRKTIDSSMLCPRNECLGYGKTYLSIYAVSGDGCLGSRNLYLSIYGVGVVLCCVLYDVLCDRVVTSSTYRIPTGHCVRSMDTLALLHIGSPEYLIEGF